MMGPRNNDGTLEPFRHEMAEAQLAACIGTSRIVEGWLSTYALGLQRRAERRGGRQLLRGHEEQLHGRQQLQRRPLR